ncbi:MAG: 3-hydroxyacyl-CoA dehydrogenase NAD-binding domain-containing protein [Pseudomonadota bacterium]
MMNLQHWHYEVDAKKIAWAIFDKKESSVNTLDHDTLSELAQIIETTESNDAMGLVIRSGKKSGFIAGADITKFQECKNPDEGLKLVLYGQEVFACLEKLKKPTLALIEGVCMGGGFELALACRYRIASDDEAVSMGLPEIKLGIHPGWGGSIRLPRLIGALQALPIILSGKSLSAYQAGQSKIVDYVLPKRELENAACAVILQRASEGSLLGHPSPSGTPARRSEPSLTLIRRQFNRLSNMSGVRTLIANFTRKQIAKKTVMSHYPALEALISQWEKHGVSEEAYAYEAASLVSLFPTETSQNLIRLFFLQTRMKSGFKDIAPVQHVHVIGAGTMGGDIAAWCALSGIKVTLQDREATYIAPAIVRAQTLFNKKLKLKHLVQAANDRLIPDIAGNGICHADVIIEAIYENLEAKQAVFKDIEKRAKPTAVLATNTSSIALDEINAVLANPSRLVGIHFFNPVSMMQLVEVVRGEKANETVLNQAMAFVKQIKRLPLPVKSRPGFLVNRILMPYLMESMLLLEEGVPMEKIDDAAVQFGMPMGPVELADTVGLDICLSVAQELTKYFGGEVPKTLIAKVAQKQLGKKTSKGFYTYHNGKKEKKVSGTNSLSSEIIADRLIYRMINESAKCLSEGIVADADMLDAGMVFGTGFAPFRGGPMQYVKTVGIEQVRARFKALQEQYGERFAAEAYFI